MKVISKQSIDLEIREKRRAINFHEDNIRVSQHHIRNRKHEIAELEKIKEQLDHDL